MRVTSQPLSFVLWDSAGVLGGAPGAMFFVGADTALVSAAAAAGLRSFRYTRLARDVLGRRLRG